LAVTADVDALISSYATVGFTGSTRLLDAGVESLSLLRLAVEAMPDGDVEIDVIGLTELRTIEDLRAWLADLAGRTC